MRHHLDTPIASELSQRVFMRRSRRHELGPQTLNSINRRRLHALPSVIIEREEKFMADLESVPDSFQGAAPVPTWHWHGKRHGTRRK